MNASIEKYLKVYNIVQLAGWLLAIISLPFSFLFSCYTIFAFQILSVLEIFHAYKKWNNSSPLFCFIQIGARIMILSFSIIIIFATFLKPIPYFENVVYLMFAAWCIAEIIRYAYYVSQLFQKENKIIVWLRYSAFIICYPIGVACEFFIIYNVFKYTDFLAVKIMIVIVGLTYFYFFPILFNHLIKQRKLKLNTTY